MSDSEKKKFRIFYEVAIIIILILLLLLLLFRPKDNELVIPSTNDSEMITDNSNNTKVTPDDIQDEQKDTNISPVSDLLRPAGQPFVPTSSTAPAPTPTPEPVDSEPTPEVTRFSVTLSTNTYGVIKDSSEKTTTILVEEGKTIEAANKGIKIGGETYISALPDDNEYAYSAFVYNNTCGNTVTSDCEVEYKYDRTLKSYSVNFGINNPDNADLNFSLFTDRVKTYTIPVPYGTESELTDDNVIRFFGRGLDFYVQTELMLNTVEYTYDFAGIVENTCGATITKECTVIFGASRTLNEYSVTFMMAEVGNDIYYTEQKKYGETFNIDELDVPVRDGYIFLGWIDADDNTATGTVTIDGNMRYRATWKKAVLTMQNVADWKDEIEVEEQVQAVDERDGKMYWVAKLKDGNIWMTQNLDYDIVAGDNIVSNNDGTTSIWNSSSAYAPTETATQLVAATRSLTGTYSYDNGDKGYINGASTETTGINCNTTSNSGEDCHYHMGNFYQWNAATAGTGGTITGQDAPSSICPKGWRLPIGNSYTADKSFGKLTNAYGITADNNATTDAAFIASPLYFLRGGGIDNRGNIVSLSSPSDLSSYWSSTATDTTDRAYRVYIMKDGLVSPTARYTRDHSFFVRCVANVVETPEPVARTMQNVADWKDELEEEEQVQVPDERDGKLYWVAKLKDGNVWMTQNLDYDIKPEDNIVAKLDGTTTTWSPNVTTSPTVYYDTTATGKQSYDPGNKYMPNGTGNFVDIVCDSSNMGDENCHYHVGNYYQWNAATAETGKDTKYDDDATLSICPAGWRLPSNNSYTNEYTIGKLTNAYGITNDKSGSSDANMLISPLYFNRPGYVYYGSVYNFKDRGFYWAGMARDTPNATVETAYNLSIQSNLVLPDGSQGRDRGVNVRCVAI